MKKERQKYINQWQKEKKDRIQFLVAKGKKDIYQRKAAENNLSLGKWIESCLDNQIDQDHTPGSTEPSTKPGLTYKKS